MLKLTPIGGENYGILFVRYLTGMKKTRTMKNHCIKTVILTLGDPSLRDAGTGPFLHDLLQQLDLPDHVRIINCSSSPDRCLEHISGFKRVIIVTSHFHGEASGEVLFATLKGNIEQAIQGLPMPIRGIEDKLRLLYTVTNRDSVVEWILIGVEPRYISPGYSLSDDVIKAAPKILKFIHDLVWEANHDKEQHYQCSND
jgi:hydrogenase maturation protease